MTDITPGAAVKHAAYRETGRVRTVMYDWRRRPIAAWVEFVINGVLQARQLKARDLTVVPS